MNLLLTSTAINYQTIIFGLIGGLGIFLYGIHAMGESIKILAGDKMKAIIEKYTTNPLKGLLVGTLVTVLLQSSSGTTALTIGLVRAGLMTFPQSIGIIMGANIGTTVTAFLIGLKISNYSLLFVGVGAFLIFFMRNKKLNTYGKALLGFGLIFLGMQFMGAELKALAKQEVFNSFMLKFGKNPLLAVLGGTGLTALVQSSSASTGIVQSLYESDAISLRGAIPMLLGNNIGTTITAILAAIGGSIAAKRASIFHVIFNVTGAILFLLILNPYYNLIVKITEFTDISKEMEIAVSHIIFNFTMAFLLIWFVKQLEWLVKKIIPGTDKFDGQYNDELFNEVIIHESPVLALESSKKAILHMTNIVEDMFNETYKYAKTSNVKTLEEAQQLETIINALDRKIHDYLIKLTSSVEGEQSKILSKYLDTIRDLERIGDHCENILEVCEYIDEHKGSLTEKAWVDLDLMFDTVRKMIENSKIIIDTNEKDLASKVVEIEDSVDRLEKKARKRHIKRVNEGICTSETNVNFVELLSNLERIGDHCCNIAEYALNEDYYVVMDEEEFDLSTYHG
ncbi:Na/Pi cotransporter family protein [Haloplasma contractile]|uniref:PhoU domain protein n=1 Tax=Haloplasma contractile SSD-17B TaxID=1033810 RepID=F7Q0S5_9MOLU|nr:Na/Pi cotransporter family protein [Haloplasma contractile]ERJ11299.1 PhoU domain protein [Haloplasma contractile SSD-17B]